MRIIKRLNEEIARWAFEIIFKTSCSWKIAFTNPTAGPWKTIKADSKFTGNEGEVYRFILEEDRPDIIIYNDVLESVIIFEAKDSLEKLLNRKQAVKSAAVVVKLADLLQRKSGNAFWNGRETYKVILGLLWGSTDSPESDDEKNRLYDHYHSLIQDEASVYKDIIVGVETLYSRGKLTCAIFFKTYSESEVIYGQELIKSLSRPLNELECSLDL